MAAVIVHSILELKKIKYITCSTFSPFICHEVMGPDVMILVLWMLSTFVFLFYFFNWRITGLQNCVDLCQTSTWISHMCVYIYIYENDGTRCHDLVFWMLSFKPGFSLSCFTFIKRLFSSSLLSALSMVSSAYLRLLIFLPAILIPACDSSNPAILMMYSAYKLSKQSDNMQLWCTSFPILN